MAKYRPVLCTMWDDPDFENYPPEGKLLFLYLCTNRRTTESGIYPITIKSIKNETCIKEETIKKLLANSLKNVTYDFENSFVFVHRFLNYNSGGRPERIEAGIKSDNLNYQTPLWNMFIEKYPHLKSGFETKNLITYKLNTNTITNTITKEPLPNGSVTVSKPLKKMNKETYLECVELTDIEYKKLVEKEGKVNTDKAIEFLNNYKMSSGKKYKSDYHSMLNWVFERIKQGGNNGTNKRYDRKDRNWAEQQADEETERINREWREAKAKAAAGNP